VLEPQGTLFFLLLMVAFGALLVWLVLTRQVVFRVLAACLAFIPAMVFGIAAVNKYYDYYQSWGSLFADLSGQSSGIPQIPEAGAVGQGKVKSVQQTIAGSDLALDAQDGALLPTRITGRQTHISRLVYIYLPPEYFRPAYKHYTFPAIELLHGSPGEPQTWINVMDVISIFLKLLSEHKAQPAVLVIPDTDGGLQYSLQCLNDPNPHGVQDMTFVGREVPEWVAANLRVQRPGATWGIAGYSEGGFCAANIALQYATRFGYAGVLSGYFQPLASQVPLDGNLNGKPHDVYVFQHHPALAAMNTPDQFVMNIPPGIVVPGFFLAAGTEDPADVNAAKYFKQLVTTRTADVQTMWVNGGGHQARVWRAALTPMLTWMTTQLALQVQHFEEIAAGERAAAKRRAEAQAHHHPLPRPTAHKTAAPRKTTATPRPTTTRRP
jgi:enterochelin esterase-like enzyme